MPEVSITEKGCRGCTLCVDICPVDVFTFDEEKDLAQVAVNEDCIGCLSCYYICPSQCIEVTDTVPVRPFHRIEENVALVEQFLQTKSAVAALNDEELDVAYNEVGILLSSFAGVITEILGRGHKSVGRRAGVVAATHLPEMYEQTGLPQLLGCMHKRFGSSFDFQYTLSNENDIDISVEPCGLLKALQNAGEQPGESNLCLLFHEYWAGLISTFTGVKYSYEVVQAGETCRLKFLPHRHV